MSETGWAAISAVVALIALVVSVAAFFVQRTYGDLELARALHADLTTGEVARAREDLGTLVLDPRRISDGDLPRVRTSYFTLLWCFERINAGRSTIAAHGRHGRRPLRFLASLIRWPVEYWSEHLTQAREELERRLGGTLDDTQSHQAFEDLKRAVLGIQARPRPRGSR